MLTKYALCSELNDSALFGVGTATAKNISLSLFFHRLVTVIQKYKLGKNYYVGISLRVYFLKRYIFYFFIFLGC